MREENAATETEESQSRRRVVNDIEFAARAFGVLFKVCGISFGLCLLLFFFMRMSGWKLRIFFETPHTFTADYHAKEKE